MGKPKGQRVGFEQLSVCLYFQHWGVHDGAKSMVSGVCCIRLKREPSDSRRPALRSHWVEKC